LFDQLYSLLVSVDDPISSFIHGAYLAALSRAGTLIALEKYIHQVDPDLLHTRHLWAGLSTFLTARSMFHNLFHLNCKIRNHLEDAALSACDLFAAEPSAARKLSYLSHAQFCLSEALHFRLSRAPLSPPFRPRAGASAADVERQLARTSFLHAIVQFCLESAIPFRDKYNFLSERADPVALGALLLTRGGGDKVAELCRLADVDRRAIDARVAAIVAALPVPELLPCIRENARHWGPGVPGAILRSVAQQQDAAAVLVVVSACWADAAERCAVFIEYGLLMEAFTAAMAYRIQEFIPLIAHRASLVGLADVVKNCERILA
jgi:hypothetical protein